MIRVKCRDDQTDTDLLRLFHAGEEEAFVLLYRRHQGAVFRFALHMSGSREAAEEVTQEVFLSLLAAKCRFDPGRGSLEAFLLGAARNQVRKHERQARTAPLNDTTVATDAAALEPDLQALRLAILDLPRKYRETVVLCDIEELSYAESAFRLQCPVGTVRSRLHRAHALLAGKLAGRKKIVREACAK